MGDTKIFKSLVQIKLVLEKLVHKKLVKAMRPAVFWPPAFILLAALGTSLINFDGFVALVSAVNQTMLAQLGWLFSLATFAALVLAIIIGFSPLGRVRIGGADARPILPRWNWFAITLCTTIATGILFWAAAEPMYHLMEPPAFAGVEGDARAGQKFALSTLFLHWSFTPYAIYTIPSLAFALSFYNFGGGYSLGGPLRFVFGRFADGAGGALIDALALFALVTGVAASLGAGVMTLAGGLGQVFGLADTVWTRFVITAVIVAAYVVSSISGLQRGIKLLSDFNVRFFLALCAFVLIAGPTFEILVLGVESFGVYMRDLPARGLGLGGLMNDPWTMDWTVFFFANWLAWAPITALFLGRIAVGYTVREFLLFNLVIPALFGIFWMTIFGGAAILGEVGDQGALTGTLTGALQAQGPEGVVYALFEMLPWAKLMIPLFVIATFISFVTAMDSNTHAIAGVCLKADHHDHTVADLAQRKNAVSDIPIKLFWGVLIGAVSWVMTATNGIDGMRLLVNFGGVPGLFILLCSGAALIRIMVMMRRRQL